MSAPDVARAEELLRAMIDEAYDDGVEQRDDHSPELSAARDAVLSLVRDLARRAERSEEALDAAHIVCNAVEMGLPMHRIEAAVAAFRKTQVPSSPDATDDRSTR